MTDLRGLSLPDELMYKGHDLSPEVLRLAVELHGRLVPAKFLTDKPGFGLVTSRISPVNGTPNTGEITDLPGFGVAQNVPLSYPFNGLRKIFPLLRARALFPEITTSLQIKYGRPELFVNPVASEESDGRVLAGDFPHGGGVYLTDGVNEVYVGVSVYDEYEDTLFALALAAEILRLAALIDGRLKARSDEPLLALVPAGTLVMREAA